MHAMKMENRYETAAKRLLEKKNRLVSDFAPNGEAGHLRDHTRILDDYFREQFEQSSVGPTLQINRNPYAIIALGGYGRREQCLHSDVDVLFLFNKRLPEGADALIREMVYPLWDIGLDIGHATRSLQDCIGLAGKDYEVLTSLLDARFICGMSPLYSELMERVREKILFRRSAKIISWLVENTWTRHGLFGDASYLLEPNLKEGQGGLRDYHAMLWIARVKFGLQRPRDLEYLGILSHEEFAALQESLTFIWNVRSGLHRITGRKYDHLHFEYQPRMADMLAYRTTSGLKPVERFLSDLHGRMERIKQSHLVFLYELGGAKKWFNIRKKKVRAPKTPGIEIRRDQLAFSSSEAMLRDPSLLIRIFEESARLKLPIGPEARRLIREFSHLVDEGFRGSREVVRSFERILTTPAPTFNVLNEMLNTGFLARFLPPFREIANRIQYNAYHVYPVDKHALRTVRILKGFADGGDGETETLCADLYRELPRKRLILWAALLHDIGKGIPGRDHSEAGAETARDLLLAMGLRKSDAETAAFLIREHLLLFKNATRRDINDAETALSCAARIGGDPERLKMLYLLTVADFMATGPKAWNDWVAILVRDLFFKVLRALERGEGTAEEIEAAAREKRALILSESFPLSKDDLQALFRAMSPRYLLAAPADAVRSHIRLAADLGDRDFAWTIARNPQADTRTLTLCGRDAPGLFSKIAGVLALNRVNILDAQIHTWRNGLCINIFNVTPPPDPIFESEKWDRAEKDLREALAGDRDLTAEPPPTPDRRRDDRLPEGRRPNRVNVDNAASTLYTLVEVFTTDEPGLLFRITDALHRRDLDIKSAQIATKVDQVVDVFYVQDLSGEKIEDPTRVEDLRAAVEAVLPSA
jgi:[protein-PII] uridylyltransferase